MTDADALMGDAGRAPAGGADPAADGPDAVTGAAMGTPAGPAAVTGAAIGTPAGPAAVSVDGAALAAATVDGPPFDAARLATEIQRRLGVRATRDVPLGRLTTMRVGGTADLFAVAHNLFELRGLVRFARARAIPYFLLGRGSDVVFSDAGLRGLVIHVRAEGHQVAGERLVADAGLPMAKAATVTAAAGLSGMEFGLAIPGNVGGAVWANAGAHGSDVAAILDAASVLLADGSEARLSPAELGLAYRESRFKHADPAAPAEAILAATFTLVPEDPTVIRRRLDDIRRWRQAHQPLGIPSAGSVFRNPPDASAGALIDGCGLKGRRIGGAVVSEKHANFILNDRGGSAADVRRLAEEVRAAVERERGVRLAFEVSFVGDWSGWTEVPA